MRTKSEWALALVILVLGASTACSDDADGSQSASSSGGASSSSSTGQAGETASGAGGAGTGGVGAGGATGGGGQGGEVDPGPNVDTSSPQLYETSFGPEEADPAATLTLETQLAYLDTRVAPRGRLVVYLHGAGTPTTCGSTEHGKVLAAMGYHVFSPCYSSGYGVGNCGDDIEGCRLEAFEGVDHHAFIDISVADSIEGRVVAALAFVQASNPEGDWTYYLDGDAPRWDRIIVSGISHGASTSGVIGIHRNVDRVVMLSGPLDSNQAWLSNPPITPLERFWGFTHTDDDQHAGHLVSFETMGILGEPVSVDDISAPFEESHRLITSAPTDDGHGSTQAGGSSPTNPDDSYVFLPVWQTLYGAN